MMDQFHPAVQAWFAQTFTAPTAAQQQGWASIREGRATLIAAPTGSGKTLAAFLSALNDLACEAEDAPLPDEVRVVYVSPLKALSSDIHKNLAEPRRGIRRVMTEMGLPSCRVSSAVRTGDTTQAERAAMLRTPPHILVTTMCGGLFRMPRRSLCGVSPVRTSVRISTSGNPSAASSRRIPASGTARLLRMSLDSALSGET